MLAPLGRECNGHFCAQTLCGDLIVILFHYKDNTEHYFDLIIQSNLHSRLGFTHDVFLTWLQVNTESVLHQHTHAHTRSTDLLSLKFPYSMIWSGLIILSVKTTYTVWICYTLTVFLLGWYEFQEKSSLRPVCYKKHLKFIKTQGKKSTIFVVKKERNDAL